MSRSIWKGLYVNHFVGSKKILKRKKKIVWARNSIIPESLVNHIVYVYNGKSFVKVYISRNKVGFKMGEFAPTRKYTQKYEKLKHNIQKRKKNK
jgi:small subunit ribosomal protein S19